MRILTAYVQELTFSGTGAEKEWDYNRLRS